MRVSEMPALLQRELASLELFLSEQTLSERSRDDR